MRSLRHGTTASLWNAVARLHHPDLESVTLDNVAASWLQPFGLFESHALPDGVACQVEPFATEVEEVEGNRVALNVNIKEGKTALVKQVNIVGNEEFDDETLLDLFDTGLTNMWSFWTDNDKYAREKVAADIERLSSFYLDQGYAQLSIDLWSQHNRHA